MKATTLLKKLKNTQKLISTLGDKTDLSPLIIEVSGLARAERSYQKILKEGKKGTIRDAKRDLKNVQEYTNKLSEAIGGDLTTFNFKNKVVDYQKETKFEYVKGIIDENNMSISPKRALELMQEQGVDPSEYNKWIEAKQFDDLENEMEKNISSILNEEKIDEKTKKISKKFNRLFKKLNK